jgi:hypothetical protein
MSRVERTENGNERRSSEQRQAHRARTPNRRLDSPGHTPGQAEGDERDVEEALERQTE